MNFLAELKRRNVIRMAGLYLVGAWLIIQIAETLLPIFHTPDWVLQALVVLLAIGFIPALVFSWVFELTPEGLKRDAEVTPEQSIASQTGQRMDRLIFAGLLALIAVIAADRYWPRDKPVETTDTAGQTSAAATTTVADAPPPAGTEMAIDPNSIAVLPFVNMSADADNEYFSDGISEELLNVLVRVDGLSVASRTSSFAYKGRELSAAKIGEELKVAHVLEGSVRKSGNRVRITAQLIDTASDRHLWSETFDRELTDIFAIQDEIAKAIVAALRESLGEKAPAAAVVVKADTENLQAYDLYLKARELFIARTDLSESVRLFEQVVAMDPKFARGWEGLAAVTSVVESWGIDDRDYNGMVVPAAERALQLDPSLSMAWAALAMAEQNLDQSDWARSLELSDKAIAADAKNATAYLWRSIAWLNLGFFDRALADQDQCLRIDPAYGNCTRWKALALLFAGEIDQALALFEVGVAAGFIPNRSSDFVPAMVLRGNTLAARLMLDKLKVSPPLNDLLIASLSSPEISPVNAATLIQEESDARLRSSGVSLTREMAYLWVGDFDRVAESQYLDNYSLLAWQLNPRAWRNSSGFKRVLRRTGVVDYWQAHGLPPQCRPVGEDDFECAAAAPPKAR